MILQRISQLLRTATNHHCQIFGYTILISNDHPTPNKKFVREEDRQHLKEPNQVKPLDKFKVSSTHNQNAELNEQKVERQTSHTTRPPRIMLGTIEVNLLLVVPLLECV